MTITRDVVRDLLPLYVAGEASADTRAAVEAFLKDDPGLAAEAAALREDAPFVPKPPAIPMAADRQALERTRHLLRQRTGFLAAAIFFTLLPLTVILERPDERFIFSSMPGFQLSCWLGAAVLWVGYAMTRQKVRITGL